MVVALQDNHAAGFSLSLLTLLKGAAGETVDNKTAQHDQDSIKSSIHRSDSMDDDNKTSTFTADMLRSLPDDANSNEMKKMADRSNVVLQHQHLDDVKEEEDDECSDNESVFGQSDTRDRKQLSQDDQLKVFLDVFGPSEMSSLLGSEEKYVASVTAYYVDDVVVKGYALATTHRFFFFAYLPKKAGLNNDSRKDETIIAGPGHFHCPARGSTGKRRVWFELKENSLVGYPSSQKLYEPLGSALIINIKNLADLIEGGKEVHFIMRGDPCWMRFDTNEAATAWHRELSGAIWQTKHEVDTLRIAIPLLRVAQLSTSIFMDFSEVIHFKVDQSGHKHDFLTRLKSLNIGVHLSASSDFISVLKEKWSESQEWKALHGDGFHHSPLAVLDVQDSIEGEAKHHHLHIHHRHSDKPIDQEKQFLIDEFALAGDPEAMHVVRADVVRGIPNGGHLILTPDYLCFYSRRIFRSSKSGVRTKIPIVDIKGAQPGHAFRWHHYGIQLELDAHADISFELHSRQDRDNLEKLIKEAIIKSKQQSIIEKQAPSSPPCAERLQDMLDQDVLIPHNVLPKLRSVINVDSSKHMKLPPMKIACLTIGSRGDVQPYIALCKSLMEHGHHCVIVSHPEYKEWVNKNGIEFRSAGGDPGILMKLSVENKMFSPTFFTETLGKFRSWLDELLREIIEQCYDVELIIESPSTFGGIHAAEALEIGYMRAFTMPWTKTSAYPQAFSVPSVDLGAGYNSLSYDLYEQVIWTASEGQVNRWRKHMLGLSSTSLAKLHLDQVPFMYNFSPGVVPPPLDWGNLTIVTGYWNLPSTSDHWNPPYDLEAFLSKARNESKKLAYIGFGSITIPNAHKTMQMIFDAAHQAGVYCVVSKGWSDRMEDQGNVDKKPWNMPDNVYLVDSIPHDWLFPKIDIAMHHGGAGTTGASLANKLITLIHPFFGDQFFWAGRVEKLGAGKRVASLNLHDVRHALSHAAQDRLMKEKAIRVGEAIKADHGVEAARAFIYRHYNASKRTARRGHHSHHSGTRRSSSMIPTKEQQRQQQPGLAERQDSGLALVLVQSPLAEEEEAETPGEQAKHESEGGGSYSSKRAKQEDIDRRSALLEKCRAEGKLKLLKLLDPNGDTKM